MDEKNTLKVNENIKFQTIYVPDFGNVHFGFNSMDEVNSFINEHGGQKVELIQYYGIDYDVVDFNGNNGFDMMSVVDEYDMYAFRNGDGEKLKKKVISDLSIADTRFIDFAKWGKIVENMLIVLSRLSKEYFMLLDYDSEYKGIYEAHAMNYSYKGEKHYVAVL